jgi:hypothetical protein
MSFSKVKKIPVRDTGYLSSRKHPETVPMHPDDFEAHLAWIMAKRFHELVLNETFLEKTVYYRIVG